MSSTTQSAAPMEEQASAPEEQLTFGQRLADKLTSFMGSWKFVIGQALFIAGWIALNTVVPIPPFDPSLILLNLGLSTEAAFAGAFILMSQNRQGERDRQTNENDYHVDLSAEKTIKELNSKLDLILAAIPPEQLKAAANAMFAKAAAATNDNAATPAPASVVAPAVKPAP